MDKYRQGDLLTTAEIRDYIQEIAAITEFEILTSFLTVSSAETSSFSFSSQKGVEQKYIILIDKNKKADMPIKVIPLIPSGRQILRYKDEINKQNSSCFERIAR